MATELYISLFVVVGGGGGGGGFCLFCFVLIFQTHNDSYRTFGTWIAQTPKSNQLFIVFQISYHIFFQGPLVTIVLPQMIGDTQM